MTLTTQTMRATIAQGSIVVDTGHDLTFEGAMDGVIEVSPGSVLRLNGRHHGTLSVPSGAIAEIGPEGVHGGPLVVNGTLHNRGTRSGTWSGSGSVVDFPGSVVLRG